MSNIFQVSLRFSCAGSSDMMLEMVPLCAETLISLPQHLLLHVEAVCKDPKYGTCIR